MPMELILKLLKMLKPNKWIIDTLSTDIYSANQCFIIFLQLRLPFHLFPHWICLIFCAWNFRSTPSRWLLAFLCSADPFSFKSVLIQRFPQIDENSILIGTESKWNRINEFKWLKCRANTVWSNEKHLSSMHCNEMSLILPFFIEKCLLCLCSHFDWFPFKKIIIAHYSMCCCSVRLCLALCECFFIIFSLFFDLQIIAFTSCVLK